MRFGLVHRVMTDALAVLGILAVVSTAALSPWATVALLAGLAFALAVPESWQTKPWFKHTATTGMLLLFIVQFTRIILGNPVIDVMVEFAALLQIIRLATRRGAAHDQQIIVLALLHFVAGTVLGGGLAYGLCFLGFLIVAPGALVLSHLRREVEGNYRQGARDRTGLPVDVPRILRSRRVVGRGFLASTCLISVPIFVFTALLFVLFPRVGLSLLLLNHPHPGRIVGFTDHVKIDEVGMIRSNPQMALRFELNDMPSPPPPRMILRLRGTAFDKSDGVNWTRTTTARGELAHNGDSYALYKGRTRQAGETKITFDVEPIDPPVIFLPPRAVSVQLKPQSQALMNDVLMLQGGPEGEYRYTGGDTRGIRYEVTVADPNEILTEPLAPTERPRYLEVPALPARIAQLAHKWADAQPTQTLKARAIEEHLRKDFKYDLNSPSGGASIPLDDFLFESKRGHCEFFSTAMALMLRDVGIPSRNVTGFVGGTYNRFGHYYAVREGEAHSWVEAYIDDVPSKQAWSTFDPTPSAGAQPLGDTTGAWVYMRDLVEAVSQRWNHYVVGYDLRSQVHLYDWFRGEKSGGKHAPKRLYYAIGALVLAALAYVAWRRRKLGPRSPAQEKSKNDRGQQVAASMYRVLEQALVAQGLSRPPSLPPLRFAEELKSREHPLATEVIDLTEIYLSVRFGGTKLDDDALRGFDRRVRAVRSWKRAAAAS